MAFYEILYRRISAQVIKSQVHGRLYPDDSEQNKLTKTLVLIASQAKKAPVPKFSEIFVDSL